MNELAERKVQINLISLVGSGALMGRVKLGDKHQKLIQTICVNIPCLIGKKKKMWFNQI